MQVVIPVQFVLFTLSAIIGSAILYGDFKKAKFHQIVTFFYGCAATFAGVFIISWAPNPSNRNSDGDPEDTDVTDALSTLTVDERRVLGSIGRRRRAALIIPSRTRNSSITRSPHRIPNIIGLSPAQVGRSKRQLACCDMTEWTAAPATRTYPSRCIYQRRIRRDG